MGIYGVGIDLVRIERLERSLNKWGLRFQQRLFTQWEIEHCSRRKNCVSCLALRFAAKEAFAKALGTGIREPLSWLDIEVRNHSQGKPEIRLSPRAFEFCRDRGICSWHLSLTDDGAYGAAVVVLEH